MRREIARGISFPFRFSPHGRVAVSKADYYDHTHIKESITQIVLTGLYERSIEPTFGSRMRELVFDGYTPALDNVIKDYIRKALQWWEPRIEVEQIDIERQTFDRARGYDKLLVRVHYELTEAQQIEDVEIEVGGVRVA